MDKREGSGKGGGIMEAKSQDDAVLDWLQQYGSIEPMQALGKLGCYRLSAVIYRLRKAGYKIKTSMIKRKGKFRVISYGKYTLENK